MPGHEHSKNIRLGRFERGYIALFGYPALGLHVRAAAIQKILRRLPEPRNVLDAGCGSGVLTFEMAKLYKNAYVVGVDNRQDIVNADNAVAEKCNLRNCMFLNQDLYELSSENKFDLILSTDNMEHMEDDERLLTLFYTLLVPGGSLILHVPHMKRNLFGWKRTNFMGIEGHVRPGYYKNELEEKVSLAGLHIVKSSYSYNSFETLFNDVSCLITGGREKNRHLYAMLFPILLLLTKLARFWPVGVGSGIVVHARKPI